MSGRVYKVSTSLVVVFGYNVIMLSDSYELGYSMLDYESTKFARNDIL